MLFRLQLPSLVLLLPLALSTLDKVAADAELGEEHGWVLHLIKLLSDLGDVLQPLRSALALDEVFKALPARF